MTSSKKLLSEADIEAQTALELPDREEMSVLFVVVNRININMAIAANYCPAMAMHSSIAANRCGAIAIASQRIN